MLFRRQVLLFRKALACSRRGSSEQACERDTLFRQWFCVRGFCICLDCLRTQARRVSLAVLGTSEKSRCAHTAPPRTKTWITLFAEQKTVGAKSDMRVSDREEEMEELSGWQSSCYVCASRC